MAAGPIRPLARRWTPERVADALVPMRDHLVERLPREIAAARGLTRDQRELIVDEAIDYMVTQYTKPIMDRLTLDRAFWSAASFRVRRAHEGRGATVRAGWQRVDLGNLELPATEIEPESAAVERIERETLLEFAATLTLRERHVLACKYNGERELGRVLIARRLGLPADEVRRAERSIARKLEAFAAIISAGTLCELRQPAIMALAEGADAVAEERAARMHLRHCTACQAEFATHLHAVRTGALQRRLGQLLPLPAVTEAGGRRRGPWETVWDWLTRPFAHESAVSAAQVGAGRGIGTAIAAKLGTLCLAGGAIVGGGAYCIDRLGDEPPAPPAIAAKPRAEARTTPDPPLPTGGRSAALQTAAQVEPAKTSRHRRSRRSDGTAFAAGAAATRHEREAPISPPVTTSNGSSIAEFEPGPVDTAAPKPAAAPATGAPEFP
jgi:hypothetical protein